MGTTSILNLMLLAVIVLSFFNDCDATPFQHDHHGSHHLAAQQHQSAAPATVVDTITSAVPVISVRTEVDVSSADAPSPIFPSVVGPCSGSSCVEPPSESSSAPTLTPCSFNGSFDDPTWDRTCNIDFPEQNIYPFLMAGSYDQCLAECNQYNTQNLVTQCQGFVFAPDREEDQNDCYLKSSVDEPSPATIHLLGATLVTSAPTSSSSVAQDGHQHSASAISTGKPASTTISAEMVVPSVSTAQLLGASTNNPTDQYVEHRMALPIRLPTTLLKSGTAGINLNLTTNYQLASDTGAWTAETAGDDPSVASLVWTPHLSRDGGKGGTINGSHIFIFCDTGSYNVSSGELLDLKSASAAIDESMNGLNGKSLVLVDELGGWQDNVARMRGFSQLTAGEEAFNVVMAGDGYRYAVWPESSLIPLNATHSILYAALVYDQVDMQSQAANFTTLGNTLLLVSIDPVYGPNSQRISQQLFRENEVSWGTLGGLRSWGPSGPGSNDGSIYLFGQVAGGVLLARTTPDGIANPSAYTYWDGLAWSSGMLPPDDTSYVFNMSVMDLDVIYSPFHKTFIAVYLTPDADNTFYYRYLQPESGILPPYAGGNKDFVQNIVKYSWSDQQVLYKAATPPMNYIYSGAVHAGYFGAGDIANGGKQMLISWTQHTGQDPTSSATGYAHMTVIVSFE